MNKYEKVIEKIKKTTKYSDTEIRRRIKLAQAFHNPLNFDNGEELKELWNLKILFTEAMKLEKMGNRYYFPFHDYDMEDTDTVFDAFRNCKNWKKYVGIWKKYAPKEIASETWYILAIVEMSVRGFKRENEVMQEHIKQGATIEKSTPEEDYLYGIDFWSEKNGIRTPVQVKSKATEKRMKDIRKKRYNDININNSLSLYNW